MLTGLPPKPESGAEIFGRFQEGFRKSLRRIGGRVDGVAPLRGALGSALVGRPFAGRRRMVRSPTFIVNLLGFTVITSFGAFNEDRPYDQFVREQLAGDGLGTGEALGFLVAGPHVPAATVGQEPSAIRQARADRMDEIMQTVGASLMGVTMSCARCHNHKFDPISIQDYYSMTAVFQDIEFGSRYPEFSKDHPRKQKAQGIWRETLLKTGTRSGKRPRFGRKTGEATRKFTGNRSRQLACGSISGRVTPVWTRSRFSACPARTLTWLTSPRTTVRTDTAFAQQGDRFPVGRVIDGKFGTQRWQASYLKQKKQNPWLEFSLQILRSKSDGCASAPTGNITTRPIIFSKRTSSTSINS